MLKKLIWYELLFGESHRWVIHLILEKLHSINICLNGLIY